MISQTRCHTAEPPLPHCQCLSVALGLTLGPTSCPHPHPTGSRRQSCCPMSRLLPVVVLRVLSHCLFLQGFPVVRAPVRDTQPKAQELPPPPGRDLGLLYLPLLGPCGIPPHPVQSAWLPRVPGLLQGRQGSRGCIPGSAGESGFDSRGSQGLRSPLESRRGSLGAP